MVPRMGSFRHTFAQRSKERLLSQKDGEWDFGLDSSEPYDATFRGCFRRLGDSIAKYFWEKPRELVIKAWDFGRSDPRKIIFGGKVGLALILISFLMFLKEPFRGLSRYSVWAILTVVVVFEFSIGATFSKGFNRALGTLSAGGLALGVAELSTLTGDWEEMIIIISIFIAGFLASFIRLYPTMKPYEYGFRVFLITFCFIMVSGYRTREFIETAVSRFLLICLGAGVSLTVNICIYPIWAGEDLHNLVAKNFTGVAKSLEGCVNGYLQCVEYERVPSKILTYEASDDPLYNGYRSAVESKSQEDTLLGFAIWEPPHGPYKMLKYPWKDYVKLSGALRHCAFNVMALHGCILSEIQAPPERRKVFQNELRRVGTEGAKVLQELGNRVKTMTRLSTGDILMEVHDAAEELQKKIDQKSYLLVDAERWEFGKHPESTEITIDVPSRRESESSNHLGSKCLSETKLDLRYVQAPKSWDAHNSNIMGSFDSSQAAKMEKQISWPVRRSFTFDVKPIEEESWPVRQSSTLDTKPVEEESRTYESASALSLATFSSLLIEFVARLQYLVDSFNELSEKANFKEPLISPVVDTAGFWMRLRRFRFMG